MAQLKFFSTVLSDCALLPGPNPFPRAVCSSSAATTKGGRPQISRLARMTPKAFGASVKSGKSVVKFHGPRKIFGAVFIPLPVIPLPFPRLISGRNRPLADG